MSPQELEKIRELFLKARALSVDARSAFIEDECGNDAGIRAELEQLLAADAKAGAVPDTADGSELPGATVASAVNFPDIPGYRITREINRGGQAAVYQAIKESTGRKVAVKLLHSRELAGDRERSRFDREARVLAALDHPNIVSVIDRGETPGGMLFLVMEYIEGIPLDKYLFSATSQRPVSAADESLRMFVKVAEAVNVAHLRGIAHRDLKPSNILVDNSGEPHVVDFGLARAGLDRVNDAMGPNGPVSVTGQFLGSLPWASPEQADGRPDKIDIRTDVYSLGVILYQMLTRGRFPYEVVGNMRDVLDNILNARPTPPSRVLAAQQAKAEQAKRRWRRPVAAVNPVMEAIVLKALAKKPADRYQSAGEFARDIGNYLVGLPVTSTSRRLGNTRGLFGSRRASRALAVVIVIAAAAAAGRGMYHRIVSNSPAPKTAVAGENATTDHPVQLPAGTMSSIDDLPKTFTNSIGMKFVRIEPGEFLMGSPDNELGHDYNEAQHRVTITRSFRMGACHVTRGQFAAFVKDSGYQTDAEKDGYAVAWTGEEWGKVGGLSWRSPGFEQTDEHPVVDMTWDDATAFCQWLSKKEGRRYRLPSEAEWEFACRAGATTAYPWGDNPDDGKGWANCSDLTLKQKIPSLGGLTFNWSDGFACTSPVASFRPNAWGLYDMIGNAWEWCGDWYGNYVADTAPNPTGPTEGSSRVMRGGSWQDGPTKCRAANRRRNVPGNRYNGSGFRVVLSLETEAAHANNR